MKISIPFLLSSGGWGLLIEAGCAMEFRGEDGGFTFVLDAARTVSFFVIRGRDCADVLRRLSALSGRPSLLQMGLRLYPVQGTLPFCKGTDGYRSGVPPPETGTGLHCAGLDELERRLLGR